MGDQIRNMLVGLLMIAACAFTISLILFLKPSVGDGKKTYTVFFSNINGINEGTRVMFAGMPVGEVVSIKELSDARQQKADPGGRFYIYELKLKLDSSVTIYNTDEVGIQTSGLLGEKSIAIIPKLPAQGTVPKAVGKEPIYANSTDPLENAFNELSELATSMKGTFRYANSWLKKNGDSIADAVHSFKETMDEAEKALATINQTEVIPAVKRALCSFSSAMERIQAAIKELQDGHLFTNANTIVRDIAKGKGTIGRLITEDNMYLQFSSILSKASTMMNDINQYGVLFHLNKSWKRERLQKVTLLDSLNSPQAFESFFQKEVDDINMAMSRISMLIDKAENSTMKTQILGNKRFTKDFAELLREVDQLADNLKLYNEQLEEAQ
jgi:phospholipid/cholesterol/gamma-HCH transport system substrate-binding protein